MSKRRPAHTPTARTCDACRAKPAYDAFVCRDCMDTYHGDLAKTPAMAEDLHVEITRQSRKSSGPSAATGSEERALPYDPAASQALDRLRFELVTACLAVTLGQRDKLPADTIGAMCDWLTRHEASVALRQEGGDIVRGLSAALKRASRIIDSPPERRYIGRCVCTDRAGEPTRLYAITGEAVHRCPCGTGWIVADRMAQLEEDLRDYRMTPAEVELATAGRVKADRVRKWQERGQISGRRGKYRLGDVLATESRLARKVV